MIERQLLASLSSLLGTACTGMTTTFTSTILPQIHKFLDDETMSWLPGTNMLAQLFGIIVGSFLMRIYGRRPFLMWLNVPWLIGWVCLSLADSLWILLVGCFIIGFVSGFYSNLATIYIIEMPEPNFRGFFAALNAVSYAVGIFLQSIIGVVFEWQTALRVSTVVPVLSFMAAFYTPESPNWLVLHRYLDKAKENFYWLRSENDETCQEFEELLSNDDEDVPHLDAGLVSEICSKPFIKSALIASMAVTADNVAGFDSIGAYSETIINDMSPKLNAKWGTVLIYGVSVLSCALSCALIERFPRRFLYFTSGVGILLSLIAIVVILAWNLPKYLLIVFLCAYQAAGYFGVMTIPWLLTGESFPDITREVGSGLSNVCYYTMGFISVKMNPILIEKIGIEMIYFSYACLLSIWLIILYFVMPETKGYVLQRTEFRPERQTRHEHTIN